MNPQWIALHNPTIAHNPQPTTVSLAFLHPARGIALVDVAPALTPNAVHKLYQTLLAARFTAIYPSYIPIVYCQITRLDLLSDQLEAMFWKDKTMDLPRNLGWVNWAEKVLGGVRVIVPADAVALVPPEPELLSRSRVYVVPAAATAVPIVLAALVGGATYMIERTAPTPTETALSVAQEAPPEPALPAAAPDASQPQPIAVPEPTEATPAPTMPTDQLAALVSRGNAFIARHDISAARRFYELAANNGSWIGAFAMGQTFDRLSLRKVDPTGSVASDPATASTWYKKARLLGGKDAQMTLRYYAAVSGIR